MPVLSPVVAAALGTAGELVLPVLLVVGLAGRFAALGLIVVNAVAVIALSKIAPAAMQQHIFCGARCWQRWPSTAWARGQLTDG